MTAPLAARARLIVFVNPRTVHGSTAALWESARRQLREHAERYTEVETEGAGFGTDQVARHLLEGETDVVIAAGGDGTLAGVAQGIVSAPLPKPPALAIMPLGTANNVARSLGLLSFAGHGEASVRRAVAAALGGRGRRIDLGRVGERLFLGSFALGMDADILALRNRLRRRLGHRARLGGYPLYLWCCAVNAFRRHGGRVEVVADGTRASGRFYNLLVTNVPIYAGEFRFDADNTCDDGWLDLHLFEAAGAYFVRYPQAWRRHVRYSRGDPVDPPVERVRVRELQLSVSRDVAAQIDGEELPPSSRYEVCVAPQALEVRLPPPMA